MSTATAIPGTKLVMNPKLDLFKLPPTDISILNRRYIPFTPFTPGIRPVDFNVESQQTYTDWSRSCIEIEWTPRTAADANVQTLANSSMYPTTPLAPNMVKQCVVRMNGTLITQQSDTYPYTSYITELINNDESDIDTILNQEGWYNVVDPPLALTANQLDSATPHVDYTGLPQKTKNSIAAMRKAYGEMVQKPKVMRFKPVNELFNLPKLLVPGVGVNIQIYFHDPSFFMMRYQGAATWRLHQNDIKVRLMLCSVTLHPEAERALKQAEDNVVSYPCVRQELRSYNLGPNERHFEINDPGNGRIPNLMIVGLVKSNGFNGTYGEHPFGFQKFNLSTIKQLVRGEEYPYETLELNHNNDQKDVRGYWRFLEATGCLGKNKGNLVKRDDWGQGKACTLFAFDNTANGMLHHYTLNPKLSGEHRIVLDFGDDPGENITVVVWSEYENVSEIDKNKTVLYQLRQ